MRNLQKTLCVFFIIFIGIFLSNIPLVSAQGELNKTLHFVDASSNNFPPMNVLDKAGNLTGFGREMADAAVNASGGTIEHIHSSQWVEVLDWLDTGKADFIHDTGYTQERDKYLDYSDPIIEMPEVIFVRPDEYSINNLDSLKGRTVACVNKHITHLYLQQFPEISLFVVKTPVEGIYELISGKVDAFIYPKQIALYLIQNLRLRDKIKITGEPLRTLTWSMVVKEGYVELLQLLNEGIAKVRKSGQYDRIYEKWWGERVLSGYTKEQLALFTIMTTVISLAVVLSITLFLFSRRLKKKVDERTVSLTRENEVRKIVEATLGKEKEFIKAVLENIEDGVVACDNKGVLTLFNRATREFHCLPEKPIPAEEWPQYYDLFHADGSTPMKKEDVPLFLALQGAHVKDIEMVIAPKHGKSRTLLASGQPLLDDHDNLLGAVVSLHDITERKFVEDALLKAHDNLEIKVKERTLELQQSYEKLAKEIAEREGIEIKLQHSQKMEAIGTLAGGIAHDFNNILAAILGYAEIVQEELEPESDPWNNQAEVLKAGSRARDLVRQILSFSRQGAEELQPVKVQLVVQEAIKLLRSSIPTTIEIKQNIDPQCGVILADPTQVHQVIINLCTNSYHAMREKGGVLGISIKPIEFTSEELANKIILHPGSYLKLEISDTGCGIIKANLDRIFEPYFTTKAKGEGTGLGLAMVHGIVKRFRGEITVYSEPDTGTTFHIYLPVIEKTIQVLREKHIGPLPTGSERVLLVDDDEGLVQMHRKILERLGYKVTVSTSSVGALEIFQKTPDDFDLVITDMTMPKINGADLAREILSIRPATPIVLCTVYSELINAEKAKDIGIRGYVMKPVIKKDFAKAIRKALDAS